MSQFNPPDLPDHQFDPNGTGERRSNPLGVVGFILSLLCITAPLGLLVSLIALTKRPKGFAIAGTIIGIIFTGLLILVALGARMAWPAVVGVGHYEEIRAAVTAHQSANNGQVPADLSALNLPAKTLNDGWGHPWTYTPSADGASYTLTTLGPDGTAGTADDRALASDMTPSEVGNTLGEAIGDSMKSKAKGTPSTPPTP